MHASVIAVRALACVFLLGSALALSADRHAGIRVTVDVRSKAAPLRSVFVSRPATRLDPSAHPAADPLLGVLWTISHRLIMPVAGVEPVDLVDTFAQIRGENRRHEGIDITAPLGTAVRAVTDGIILRLTQHDSGGITLYQLAPDDRTLFYYAHLQKYADGIRAGAAVRQGDVIGYVGDTGNAGPGSYHLHFEIMTAPDAQRYQAGRPHNPYPLLRRARG